MTYTLKVDWTGHRTQAVIDVLKQDQRMAGAVRELSLYVCPDDLASGSTIKLSWTQGLLNRVEYQLETWLRYPRSSRWLTCRRATDEVVHWQAEVHAALREIREYRAVTAEAVALIKRERAGELELLRSYANGPRIWDAASIVPQVWALAAKGLIEPVDANGRTYRLTEAGRKALREAGS
jgi:hypothetical protein